MKDGFEELKSGYILNRGTKRWLASKGCTVVGEAQKINFCALKFCLEPALPASISAGHTMHTDLL